MVVNRNVVVSKNRKRILDLKKIQKSTFVDVKRSQHYKDTKTSFEEVNNNSLASGDNIAKQNLSK